MSRFYSHINTAKKIIESYKGEAPLAAYLKSFFAAEKKYGSKDRKNISSLCYSYYRLGRAVPGMLTEERMLTALFLVEEKNNAILESIKPELNKDIESGLSDKLTAISPFNLNSVFSFADELSEGVDPGLLATSFLLKPRLFIRIRPGKTELVLKKLANVNVPFEVISETCLAFANATKLEDVLLPQKEYVVQDYNSQNTGDLIKLATPVKQPGLRVWDCCAASGGKSIMAADLIPEVHLTVSDVRKSIIHNLEQRFKEAAIKNYNSFVTDLTTPPATVANSPFDLIICDAPCSGSGTWSRTPEQLYFFTRDKINYYANLQKTIAVNAAKFVKKEGFFLYITCSVFKKENEDIVEMLQKETRLKLVKQELFLGYEKRADSMFAALFKLA